ncbi:hypothetical protein DRO34_06080 [Candidatus Bathyarchaeota archaeon]|nr:MAG: hypothetical protein DRO34_06080 [Candidatus Bathyarchaeota archaeon]
MAMDNLDIAVWLFPLLGVFDVASTFYIWGKGYSPEQYEVGLFASYFMRMGLIYLYVPIYLLILFLFSYILWRMKRSLDPYSKTDRFIFGLLVFVVCFGYAKLLTVIVSNVLLPRYIEGAVSRQLVELSVFIVCVFQMVWFIRDALTSFYRAEETGEETKT